MDRKADLGRNVPPSRETIGRIHKAAVRKVVEEEEIKKAPDDQEITRVSLDLETMRKEQCSLIAKQEKKYGATVDTINTLQSDIYKAKGVNNDLIAEMKAEKDRLLYLQSHFSDLRRKFESYKSTLKLLKKEKELWEDSRTLLVETEEKCKRLTKSNRHLRALLLKHHINPDVDASTMGNTIHIRKPKVERKPINAVSPRSRISVDSVTWR